MDFESYLAEFERILNSPSRPAPYDKAEYLTYAKLNWARLNRWLRTGKLTEQFVRILNRVSEPQHWIVITEPWCGDAAHSIPFLHLAAQLNPLISVEYELRDSPPFRINDYLTNGSKSIPKLIIQDNQGNDLAVWGPRPAGCQQLFNQLKAEGVDFEAQKTAQQNWYNADKGLSLQQEIGELIKQAAEAEFL